MIANSHTMMCTACIVQGLNGYFVICGIGDWLGTYGPAMQINCTKVCVYCCISHSFASGGKYGINLMVHGTMCRHMFGPL